VFDECILKTYFAGLFIRPSLFFPTHDSRR
jgi:hypothetical protein